MHTQINCPNCHTPYTAEVYQVIDAGKNPELKRRLISGQLNLAICPACGTGGQLTTATLFHDPEHEMFIVHVPQQLNLNHVDREKLIGQLVQQAMNDLPPEERKAYMLQPQTMLSRQSFMEKVLETEGITPEMIARQRRQMELLQTLAGADKDVADVLIQERIGEIDETFFAMLQAHIDAAAAANDDKRLLSLTNMRARLMVGTPAGKQLEKKQIAIHALSREAKKKNGLTPNILLKHILANRGEEAIVDALVAAGSAALTYTFFSQLTGEIEKSEKNGNQTEAQQLIAIRERLLKTYDAMQEASKRAMTAADETLKRILASADKETAIRNSVAELDDAFMYLLMSRIAEAEQKGEKESEMALAEIQRLIVEQVESQYPPEVLMVNRLMEAGSNQQRKQILDENQHLVTDELVKLLDALSQEVAESGQKDLDGRLRQIKRMVEARLAT